MKSSLFVIFLMTFLFCAQVSMGAVSKKRFDFNEKTTSEAPAKVEGITDKAPANENAVSRTADENDAVKVPADEDAWNAAGKASAAGKAPANTMPPNASQAKKKRAFFTATNFAHKQKEIRDKVAQKVNAMRNGEEGIIGAFLALCFLYGLLHALGPGHGKSIVVGYFLARKGRWREGAVLGAGITFAHTLSAVVLLFALYAVLKAAVFPSFEMGRGGIEKASYVLVMITGIMLMAIGVRDAVRIRKMRGEVKGEMREEMRGKFSCGEMNGGRGELSDPCEMHDETHAEMNGEMRGVKRRNVNDDMRDEMRRPLGQRASWKELIGVAIVTGIVPCPAVALIVLFCLLNSMVAMALIAAATICIGMTVTNVAFGVAAIAMRKGIDKGAGKSGRTAEIIHVAASFAGGAIVLLAGYFMLTSTFGMNI